MNGDGQGLRITVEDVLCSVAVMDIPINNGHAAESQLTPGFLKRDPDVGDQAKAHPGARLSVVPRGPDQSVGVHYLPTHDRFNGSVRAPAASLAMS